MSDDLISRKVLIEEIRSLRCSITGLRAGTGVLTCYEDEYRKSILKIIDDQPMAIETKEILKIRPLDLSIEHLRICIRKKNIKPVLNQILQMIREKKHMGSQFSMKMRLL